MEKIVELSSWTHAAWNWSSPRFVELFVKLWKENDNVKKPINRQCLEQSSPISLSPWSIRLNVYQASLTSRLQSVSGNDRATTRRLFLLHFVMEETLLRTVNLCEWSSSCCRPTFVAANLQSRVLDHVSSSLRNHCSCKLIFQSRLRKAALTSLSRFTNCGP